MLTLVRCDAATAALARRRLRFIGLGLGKHHLSAISLTPRYRNVRICGLLAAMLTGRCAPNRAFESGRAEERRAAQRER